MHFLFHTAHQQAKGPKFANMQPIQFRSSSRRFKRRRVVNNDQHHNGDPLSTSGNADSFGNQPSDGRQENDSGVGNDEEDSDDPDMPVCRRIVQGVVQEPEKKQHPVKVKEQDGAAVNADADLEPLPLLESNGRSQIERLMKRRTATSSHSNEPDDADRDEGAIFRKQLAGCAEEVDDDTYTTVPVEKFGARMLAAMGWKPEKRGDADEDANVVEKQRVQRPAGLGLGAKLTHTGNHGEAAPLTHRRRTNGRLGVANGTTNAIPSQVDSARGNSGSE